MKLFRVFNVVVLCMALTMLSCSGEDGADGENGLPGADGNPGPAGAAGDSGADGISCWDLNGNGVGDITEDTDNEDTNLDGVVDTLDCQGTDGTNGTDGNANVEEHAFSLDVFANYIELPLDLNNIVDTPANYAFIFYMEQNDGTRFHIPGHLVNNSHYARVQTNLPDGTLDILFYDLNDNPHAVPGGLYSRVIAVAIELTNSSKNSQNVMASLKAAGVDVSNYKAVAAYFGLE
jgi:hypothetical protein